MSTKEKKITLLEIVKKWLQENGYDGFCTEDCGCTLDGSDALLSCEILRDYCVPAYKRPAREEDTKNIDCEVGDMILTPDK